jgi:uncharacterized membrane protein YcaP (DUF421 family)
MKKEEIHFGDWKRWLIGEAPWEFMAEVTIRTIIIFAFFYLTMRFLGKRMSAQMTIFELAVVIVLGAAISLPMESPDRGIIPGIIILLFALMFQKGLSYLNFISKKAEIITEGESSILVKDGQLLLNEMEWNMISRERLFSELRSKNIIQLGEVERVYFESCGVFSIFVNPESKAGLSILPPWDDQIRMNEQINGNSFACGNCGHVVVIEETKISCLTCGKKEWTHAVENAITE